MVPMTPDALEACATSAAEIADLLKRFEVAMGARVLGQSADGRYMHAYTAGFLLAKVVIRASDVRAKGGENHLDTLRAVPFYMGSGVQPSVDALDAARKRRNSTLYDAAGSWTMTTWRPSLAGWSNSRRSCARGLPRSIRSLSADRSCQPGFEHSTGEDSSCSRRSQACS